MPTYTGEGDKSDADEVKKWATGVFFNSLDVRGGQWDWHENLEQVSSEIDIRGDHFTLLTTNEDGTLPRIQNIPAYAVRTKGTIDAATCTVKGGAYNGNKIVHGIIYNPMEKAIAYRVSTGQGNQDYTDVPGHSIHHSFDPSLSDGRRGLPVATHALEDLKHVLQSTEYERTRQLIMSSIGLFIENDTGGPTFGDPRNELTGDTSTGDVVSTQEISPSIWYAKAGEGEKITQLKHEAGGDTFDSFHDRMIRSFCAGANWSYSLTWKPTGQGTAERGEILQARKAVISRQKRLRKWALRVLTYAYSFHAQRGELPTLENPMSWSFTKPPRLTVDDGREAKMMSDGFRLGRYNMTDLVEADGHTYGEHLEIRADEAIKRKQKIADKQNETGFTIDERELVMFTPNETASDKVATPAIQPVTETEDEDGNVTRQTAPAPVTAASTPEEFQTLKAKFDAFGVAVRSGGMTPSINDEKLFREEGGLPPMSDAVLGAWKQDEGYRRPITLMNEGAVAAAQENRQANEDDETTI